MRPMRAKFITGGYDVLILQFMAVQDHPVAVVVRCGLRAPHVVGLDELTIYPQELDEYRWRINDGND